VKITVDYNRAQAQNIAIIMNLKPQPDPTRLAAVFAAMVREEIGTANYLEIGRGKAVPCDFCDGNQVMLNAWEQLVGWDPCETGGDDIGVMSEACEVTWRAAWDLAMQFIAVDLKQWDQFNP